ncbi:N-lysine methyltransferase setd6-like [Mercenaria mercenaria]|uniref:N-lysine methyltransferase setd6-like n=1 Tax=Mercenaria mercenaria TaxID=6596 RepID=UPI00234EE995|nr:N-lysine methyltransferase setd6-like [Mercenaria mercenaria]
MSAPMKRFTQDGEKGDINNEKRSTTHDSDFKRDAFVTWSIKNNFQMSDKVSVKREGSCAQYGMVATEEIQEGEVLFQIPRSCLITPDTCAIADCLKKDAESIQGSSGWAPLLIALLYEYNNPQSHWRPYLDLVPDFKELDLPMFWPSDERKDLLQGTGVDEAVTKDLANIEKEFKEVVLPFVKKHKDKFSQVCENVEFYKKMVAFVMAYSFTEHAQQEEEDDDDEEDSGNPPPMMVPMADILNHIAKNNAHLNFEKEALKMVAVKDIKKGEEVYNTYGELANLHLLHMYGFAEEYPNNHWDTVTVAVSDIIEASKQLNFNTGDLLNKKIQLINEMFGSDANVVVGIDGVLEEQEMKTVLKICCEESKEVLNELIDDGWESDDEDTSLEFKCLTSLPDSWRSVLCRCAELGLQKYRTTLTEDQEKLKSSMLSSRQRYSLYTAFGQKQILQKMIDAYEV